jgi:hypothetical protein
MGAAGSKELFTSGDIKVFGTPVELFANLKMWVAWGGDPAEKAPFFMRGGRRFLASSTDPKTWATLPRARVWGPVGIVLTKVGDGMYLAGIDLDTCRKDGIFEDWAQQVIDKFNSYWEISPSGTGAKVFFLINEADREAVLAKLRKLYGEPKREGKKWERGGGKHPPGIELALGKRYFTVTEQSQGSLCRVTVEQLDWLIEHGSKIAGKARRGQDNPDQEQKYFADIPKKWQKLVNTGDAADYNDDRSALTFAFIMALVSKGWSDANILPFLTDSQWKISAHCLEKGAGEAQRQLDRAREKVNTGWIGNAFGQIAADNQDNIRHALDEIGAELTFDIFAQRELINDRYLDDAEVNNLRFRIENECKFRPGKDLFYDLCGQIAREHSFHPVLDYLDELKWDGNERLDDWLFNYSSAPRRDENYDKYVRAIGRIVLIAAVRRLRQPGCKFDELVVLVNPTQGTDKSTALTILSIKSDWFTDSVEIGAKDKVAIEQTQGKWIVELGEMRGRRKNDVDQIKGFLSRQVDRARPAYGRKTMEMPRQSVFFSTTNDERFLTDKTGNRRFWPVFGVQFDIDKLTKDVNQLWAEAVAMEAKGESIRLAKDLWEAAGEVQEEATEDEPWVEILQDALGELQGKIRSLDVWNILNVPVDRRTSVLSNRLGDAMAQLGWCRRQKRFGGSPEGAYLKGESAEQLFVVRFDDKCWVYQGDISRLVQPPGTVDRKWSEKVTEHKLIHEDEDEEEQDTLH